MWINYSPVALPSVLKTVIFNLVDDGLVSISIGCKAPVFSSTVYID